MMLTGYAHFSNMSDLVDADHTHWIRYLYRNMEAIIRIMVSISENLHCMVCDDLSLNYTTKASLANHYREHRKQTVQHFLDNYTTKTPEELHEIITKSQQRGITQC